MSLTTGEMSAADLAAVVGNSNGNGFGDMGSGWWLILLFLIFGNGWNNGYGGGNGGAGGLYPWMNQTEVINDGFRDQMLNSNITSIRDSIGDISTQLCNGFAGVEQGANARQIANMQTAFGMQTAMNQGFNSLGSQLAQCCCDNRLATCQTQNIIQSESAATRFADANNTRDIIQSQSNGTQAILDKLCQLELDGYKRENDSLRTQLTAANFRESQTAQNALISQGFANEVDQLYNRLNSCPVPTTPVYGRTPIFTCNNNTGCCGGCGSM